MVNNIILKNGIRLIYKKSTSELSSIAIALDAGAGRDGGCFGVAHATEHMVYKGTKNRSETEINEELSNIFGFQNAMTNYPYVVYYGTLLGEDLKVGLDIFADILINPSFNNEGFKEEMDVIKEELNEWDEEVEQFCEDKLFLNAFKERRTKYPIIGTANSLNNITLEDIKEFYNKNYTPGNTSITIISEMDFEEVVDVVENAFSHWNKETSDKESIVYDEIKEGCFIDRRKGVNTAKVQIIFPIDKLDNEEIKILKLFNQYFGEGVNSVLFDSLRTKNGLVYDVLTRVANENFIKVYKVTYGTAPENIEKSIELIKDIINNIDSHKEKLDKKQLDSLIKSFKLKRLFGEEQSVRLAMALSTYDTMFGDYNLYLDEIVGLEKYNGTNIIDIAKKVFENMMVEIITE